jgi:hypothetical protein
VLDASERQENGRKAERFLRGDVEEGAGFNWIWAVT